MDHGQAKGPVIAALTPETNGHRTIQQIVFTDPTGGFSFLVPAGEYYLAAFEDANNNIVCDPDEAAGFYLGPDRIHVPPATAFRNTAEHDVTGPTIHLTSSAEMVARVSRAGPRLPHVARSLVRLGTIAQLDDPIFAASSFHVIYQARR